MFQPTIVHRSYNTLRDLGRAYDISFRTQGWCTDTRCFLRYVQIMDFGEWKLCGCLKIDTMEENWWWRGSVSWYPLQHSKWHTTRIIRCAIVNVGKRLPTKPDQFYRSLPTPYIRKRSSLFGVGSTDYVCNMHVSARVASRWTCCLAKHKCSSLLLSTILFTYSLNFVSVCVLLHSRLLLFSAEDVENDVCRCGWIESDSYACTLFSILDAALHDEDPPAYSLYIIYANGRCMPTVHKIQCKSVFIAHPHMKNPKPWRWQRSAENTGTAAKRNRSTRMGCDESLSLLCSMPSGIRSCESGWWKLFSNCQSSFTEKRSVEMKLSAALVFGPSQEIRVDVSLKYNYYIKPNIQESIAGTSIKCLQNVHDIWNNLK